MCSVYGMLMRGEIVECLWNGTDRGKCGEFREWCWHGKCGMFTEWYRQRNVWRVYRIVLRGESAECLWNGFDRGNCGVFTEW